MNFYNGELEKISITGKEIGGYQEFRIQIIEDVFYLMYRKESNEYIYLIEQKNIVCNNISKDTKGSITLSLNELISNRNECNQPLGIVIRHNTNHPNEQFEAYSDDGRKENVVMDEIKFFNGTLIYNPSDIGSLSFTITYYVELSDTFYLPVTTCTLSFTNDCFKSCDSCSTVGNVINNNCDSCSNFYEKEEGTNNCKLPEGFYLDESSNSLLPYKDNCAICDDAISCQQCKDNYTLLGTYTQLETDDECVLLCDLSNSRWLLNETIFTCLDNGTKCPDDYSCYNSNKKQCILNEKAIHHAR